MADKQTVFITGASSGIGSFLAREFSNKGKNIVIVARRLERLTTLEQELSNQGHTVLAIKCDVTNQTELNNAVFLSIQKFGKIDIVVANAGFGVAGNVEKLGIEDYQRQFDTNVFGVLRTLYSTLDQLKKNRGSFVIIGSVSGYIALPGNSAYSMSKAAVHSLAVSLAHELKSDGISVTLIAPGFVDSEIRQVDNFGQYHADAKDIVPEWLKMPTHIAARQIVDATLKRKRESVVTYHGKILVLVQRHLPGLVNLFIGRGLKARPEPKRSST